RQSTHCDCGPSGYLGTASPTPGPPPNAESGITLYRPRGPAVRSRTLQPAYGSWEQQTGSTPQALRTSLWDVTTSAALLTDHYELTMLSAALRDGTAERRCVFEVFVRRLPTGRRYGVVAGTGRLIERIAAFRFGEEELAFLRERGVVDEQTAQWLAAFRFEGDVDGYAEGELFFPGSPILTVSGTFAECVILETLVLSVLN